MQTNRPHFAGNTNTLKSRAVALCVWRSEPTFDGGKPQSYVVELNDTAID